MNGTHPSEHDPQFIPPSESSNVSPKTNRAKAANRSPLIGRDTELAQLMAEATIALQGQGRVLALVGAAGIGKTRLSEEVIQRLTQTTASAHAASTAPGVVTYAGNCPRYEQHTPYSALRLPLRQLLNLYHSEINDADRVYTQCQEGVARFAPQLARFAPLLGDVLGRPFPETPLTQWLTADQRHDRLQQLLVALWRGAASQKPLVLHLDDVHWADTSTRTMLHQLTHETTDVPLLLILNYRLDPPIAEPWADQPTTTRLQLLDLPTQDSHALLEQLLADTPPPAVLPMFAQAPGNPLFIEECARALIDSGALAQDTHGHWHVSAALDQRVIPQSLEELLISRLARLDEQHHELIQVFSVIGQRFERAMIESTYSQPALLEKHIAALVAADVVVEQSAQPAQGNVAAPATYLFRHPLMRDVVYAGILDDRRRELHQRVARSIEALHAPTLDEHLALLAHHYLRAEDWLPAFTYHLAAGRQAQQRYAPDDARALFTTAVSMVPNLGQQHTEPDRSADIVEVHACLGDVHLWLGAYDEAQESYLEALRLAREALEHQRGTSAADDVAAAVVRLHHHIARVQERRADYASAFTWLGHGMQQATDKTQGELGQCFLLAAGLYQRQGQYDHALEWSQRALQIIEQHGNRNDLAHAYYALGGTYGKLGRTQEAITAIKRSLQLYTELENIAGQADAHNNLANVLAVGAGRFQESAIHCQAALDLKAMIGDVHGQAVLANNLGDLKRKMGEYTEAVRYFRMALDQFTQLASVYGMAVLHMNMGAVSVSLGRLDEARQHLTQSRSLFEQVGSEEFLAELYRVHAELSFAEGNPQDAIAWANESLALAQRQNAQAEERETRRVLEHILQVLGHSDAA